jgi:hypothetical protein
MSGVVWVASEVCRMRVHDIRRRRVRGVKYSGGEGFGMGWLGRGFKLRV